MEMTWEMCFGLTTTSREQHPTKPFLSQIISPDEAHFIQVGTEKGQNTM